MDRLLKKGLITTVIGIGILVFCAASIWTGKSTPMDLSGWLTLAITLLRAKDSLLGLEQKEVQNENHSE